MKFALRTNENIFTLARAIGYIHLRNRDGEFSFVRSLAGNKYPRFHAYVRQEKEMLFFNLHLDQKQPSYENHAAHSGEYEGELLEKERERIKKILNN